MPIVWIGKGWHCFCVPFPRDWCKRTKKVWNENTVSLQVRVGQWSITTNLWPLTTHIYDVIIIVTGGFSKKFFLIIFRSSHTQMLFKTGVVKNVTIFRGKRVLESLFNKIVGLRVCNFTSASSQKRLQHKCFPEKIAKCLQTAFFIRHLRWMLLSVW